jgi:hypothetical protein
MVEIKREDLDDLLQLGPLTIFRKGRVVGIHSDWDPEEHKEFMEKLKSERPKLKQKINDSIKEVIQIIADHDPVELLAAVSFRCILSNSNMREAVPEYLLNLIIALKWSGNDQKPSEEIIEKCVSLICGMLKDVIWFYGSERADKTKRDLEHELRFLIMSNSLIVRSDEYLIHTRQTAFELFCEHNDFLKTKFGFTVQGLLEFASQAANEIEERINERVKPLCEKLDSEYKFFEQWAIDNASECQSADDVVNKFQEENTQRIESMKKEFANILNRINSKNLFRISPKDEKETKIIDTLSVAPGENTDFLNLKNYEGWPLNPTKIQFKQILKCDDGYFILHPPIFLRNIIDALTHLIEEKDRNYYRSRFLKSRDKYTEVKTMEFLSSILNNCSKYDNLRYPSPDNSETYELDGLLFYGEALFLVEAKAGKWRASALRGSVLAMKSTLEQTVDEAFRQARRALEYLRKNEIATFYDDQQNEILRIRSQNFRYFFIITSNFEPLGVFGAHLQYVKDLGLIAGEDFSWAVYLNDLRVISEQIPSPSLFVHYLTRRKDINKLPQFFSVDELDMFVLYAKEGLYYEERELGEVSQLAINDYTADLDEIYDEGKAKQIMFNDLPEHFLKLITRLETMKPPSFVTACLNLLDCNGETRHIIDSQIDRCEADFKKDGLAHSISVVFDKPGLALIACVLGENIRNIDAHARKWADKYISEPNTKRVTIIYYLAPISEKDKEVKVYIFEKDGQKH